jgi:hypothetical protein
VLTLRNAIELLVTCRGTRIARAPHRSVALPSEHALSVHCVARGGCGFYSRGSTSATRALTKALQRLVAVMKTYGKVFRLGWPRYLLALGLLKHLSMDAKVGDTRTRTLLPAPTATACSQDHLLIALYLPRLHPGGYWSATKLPKINLTPWPLHPLTQWAASLCRNATTRVRGGRGNVRWMQPRSRGGRTRRDWTQHM